MPLRRVDSMSLFRHLLIACALLGFHLDVLPTPTPGGATSDQAGDLAWPQVKLVARAASMRPRVRSPWSFSTALAEFGRAGLGPDDLPHWPRDGRHIGSSVALSVLLCRLIC